MATKLEYESEGEAVSREATCISTPNTHLGDSETILMCMFDPIVNLCFPHVIPIKKLLFSPICVSLDVVSL
jgi:hypothetical protein